MTFTPTLHDLATVVDALLTPAPRTNAPRPAPPASATVTASPGGTVGVVREQVCPSARARYREDRLVRDALYGERSGHVEVQPRDCPIHKTTHRSTPRG